MRISFTYSIFLTSIKANEMPPKFIIVLYKIHHRSRPKHNQLEHNKVHKLQNTTNQLL
jgi:hypothetical protein